MQGARRIIAQRSARAFACACVLRPPTERDAVRLERQRYAGGTGSYPLIGSPETIAEKIVQIHRLGFSGATLSFVNFNEELPYFVDRVLPLLRQAGLREHATKTSATSSLLRNHLAVS